MIHVNCIWLLFQTVAAMCYQIPDWLLEQQIMIVDLRWTLPIMIKKQDNFTKNKHLKFPCHSWAPDNSCDNPYPGEILILLPLFQWCCLVNLIPVFAFSLFNILQTCSASQTSYWHHTTPYQPSAFHHLFQCMQNRPSVEGITQSFWLKSVSIHRMIFTGELVLN